MDGLLEEELEVGEVGQGPRSHGRQEQPLRALPTRLDALERAPVPPQQLHQPRLLRGSKRFLDLDH
jgi:hypothetical protein